MKIRFDYPGILKGETVFEEGKVYELNANRAYFWMAQGVVTSVPAFEGEILDDPMEAFQPKVEVTQSKVDDTTSKSENKKAYPSPKRGKKTHEQISETMGQNF